MITRVQRLLAKYQRGQPLSWDELLACCPYRALVAEGGVLILDVDGDPPHVDGVCFVIGNRPEAFSEKMRIGVVEALHEGNTVMLASNEQRLLHYAMSEISLDIVPPAGHA
jgi:hypothetical protein